MTDAVGFAAAAEAALTGELAVCAASCGPGNLQLINGLFDANRSGTPVLAIAAHIPAGRSAPAAGAEVLLDRAVSCADAYAPADHRAGLRERIADSALAAARRAAPRIPIQRTLAAAFAASAHREDQLDLLTRLAGRERRARRASAAMGLWAAGQEQLMVGYRSRCFGEALHALGEMSSWAQGRLGRLLFPSTLYDAATVAAAQTVLAAGLCRRTC